MHKFHYYNIRRIRFFPSTILIINVSGLIPKGLCFAIRNHKPFHLFLLEFRYRDSQNILVLLGWSMVPTCGSFLSLLFFGSIQQTHLYDFHYGIFCQQNKKKEIGYAYIYAHVISCIMSLPYPFLLGLHLLILPKKISTYDSCVTICKTD